MSAPWENWSWNWKDRSGPEYRAFVSNLPYSTNEGALRNAFSSYGPLNADVAYDPDTGRSKGFGFVQFDDQKSMDNAIQGMNGQQLGGRTISVKQANERPRRWRT